MVIKNKPTVSIVIVNFNGIKFLEQLFESIRVQGYKDLEVIILDNASMDQSITQLKRWLKIHPEMQKITSIIQENKNYGFAKGNNLAVTKAKGKYILFANSDTEFSKGAIEHMVKCLEKDLFIAGVAPKIYLSRFFPKKIFDSVGICMNHQGSPYNRGIGQVDLGQYDQGQEVMGLCFASCLVRKDVFLQMDGLDESYFAYFEDVDFSLRCRKAGYSFKSCPLAIIHHYHSGTSSSNAYAWKYYLIFRNYLRTVIKSMGKKTAIRIAFSKTVDLVKTTVNPQTDSALRTAMLRVLFRFYILDLYVYAIKHHRVKRVFNKSITDLQVFEISNGEPSNFFNPTTLQPDISLEMFDFIFSRLDKLLESDNLLKSWKKLKKTYYCDPFSDNWKLKWQKFCIINLKQYGKFSWVKNIFEN